MLGGQYPLKKHYHCHRAGADAASRSRRCGATDPEVFNPDNFTREAEAARPVNAYKPFGNGQRACIGRQFAMQEAALVLGMVLQRFKLIDHTRYQLKIKESLTIKPDGLQDQGAPAHRSRADRQVVARRSSCRRSQRRRAGRRTRA